MVTADRTWTPTRRQVEAGLDAKLLDVVVAHLSNDNQTAFSRLCEYETALRVLKKKGYHLITYNEILDDLRETYGEGYRHYLNSRQGCGDCVDVSEEAGGLEVKVSR